MGGREQALAHGARQQPVEAPLVLEVDPRREAGLEAAAQRQPGAPAELLAGLAEQHDRVPRPVKWETAWDSQGSSSPTIATVGVG